MKRPQPNLSPTPIDHLLEILGLLGLLLLIGLPILYYQELPDSIPRHFGINGEPDRFSGKAALWTLPIVGVVLYLILFLLNKHPHRFNYPLPITEENAEHVYKKTSRMGRILNTILAWAFAYITWSTIQTALERQNGMGPWFAPVFTIGIIGITGYFWYQSLKKV